MVFHAGCRCYLSDLTATENCFKNRGNEKLEDNRMVKRISRAGSCLERSSIRLFFEKQNSIAKTCDDIVSFTIGEPDFLTPDNINQACIEAIQAGKTKYAPNAGLIELKEAISRKIESIYNAIYDPENEIVITNGGMEGLRLTFASILDDGDEVLVGDPAWANHPNHPVLAGGKSVRVPLLEEHSFICQIEDLENALTNKTKALLLNYPNNPTGAVIKYDELEKICLFAKKHDLFVVSDEVYYKIIFDGEKFWSPAMLDDMRDRTVVVQSFSKTYAMTGWRLGYVAGPADIVEAVGKINENSCSCVNTAVQWAGIEALEGEKTKHFVDAMVREYQNRRDIVHEMINDIPGLSCMKPKGAFYAFINIKDTGIKSSDFSNRLLEKWHVGMTPGTGFGNNCEGYVRMSFATSKENIIEGINRIAKFVEEESMNLKR